MTTLLVFLLVAFGVIYVAVDSTIFAAVRITLAARSRFFESFIYCAYCTGFWIGVVLTTVFEWTWSTWWHGFFGGTVVMGAIAVIRGLAPQFLLGAWEREREIIDAIRERRHRDVDPDFDITDAADEELLEVGSAGRGSDEGSAPGTAS